MNVDVGMFIKIGVLIILFLYVVFAFVLMNQVRVMNRIIREVSSSAILFILVLIHLLLAVSLFFFALAIL